MFISSACQHTGPEEVMPTTRAIIRFHVDTKKKENKEGTVWMKWKKN